MNTLSQVIEDTAGKIRDLPISSALRKLLKAAAELSGVDTVRVTSGGQCAIGTCSKRIGSTRHDLGNAADLRLEIDGVAQEFTDGDGRVFHSFARNSAALGATGIGAGEGYMGNRTMHVGFGSRAVWGRGGRAANAPHWLQQAVSEGWDNPISFDADADPIIHHSGGNSHRVIASSGLHLRGGPGVEFDSIDILASGTELGVLAEIGTWRQVDLMFDGIPDGFVHAAFLKPV